MLPQCSPELAPYQYKGLNVKNSPIPSLFAGVLLCSWENADFYPPSKIFRIIFIIYNNTLTKSQPLKIKWLLVVDREPPRELLICSEADREAGIQTGKDWFISHNSRLQKWKKLNCDQKRKHVDSAWGGAATRQGNGTSWEEGRILWWQQCSQQRKNGSWNPSNVQKQGSHCPWGGTSKK